MKSRKIRKMWPMRFTRLDLYAFYLGIKDGWTQPHELCSSRNIEYLEGYDYIMQDNMDRGINLGQVLLSPLHFQRV